MESTPTESDVQVYSSLKNKETCTHLFLKPYWIKNTQFLNYGNKPIDNVARLNFIYVSCICNRFCIKKDLILKRIK